MPWDKTGNWKNDIAQALCMKCFADTDEYAFKYVLSGSNDKIIVTFSMAKPDFDAVQRRVQQAQTHFTRLIDKVIEARLLHRVVVDSIEQPWKKQ